MQDSATAMNQFLFKAALCGMATATLAGGDTAHAGTHDSLESLRLVACAPGYPSNTEQAQPTMNDFATMVSDAAGWPKGTLTAEYHSSEEAGIRRLRDYATSLALVPLPLYLKYEQELSLTALAQAVLPSGSATERWSLVASVGSITSPASLSGWELLGIPAYAPRFVRGPALSSWGQLPDSLSVKFTQRVLTGIRRVAAGEEVVVLLDSPQTTALASFPGAESLEIVATSPPLLAWLIVALDDRVDESVRQQLIDGLLSVHESARFGSVLETMQLQRFEALDTKALALAQAAYSATR